MGKEHHYTLKVVWTGNNGTGTSDYKSYSRNHQISVPGKPDIFASSDTAFRGDPLRYNPEEFLLASLSTCHMLWFLHLCADNGVVVVDYVDDPKGIMAEHDHGGGRFKEVVLNPVVAVASAVMAEKLDELHHKAHSFCFIANSVNFPVSHNARWVVRPE